ncbi:MAG: TolC family protein [Ignavibacteria bacterium]|nr:TolC family protein [Ignavibacteria bacterium]
MKLLKLLFLAFLILEINEHSVYSQKFSMNEVVKIAIENNQEIKTAKLNIKKEEAIKLKSFNIPRPELFIEFEGIKGNIKNFESRKIGILQEMEFPTNYFLRNDVQSSQVEISRQELNKLAINLKNEVENAYLSLILNIKMLETARENLKIYDDFLFTAERKYDAGATSNLEVLGAKVNKIKFENEIKNIESEIIKARSELKKLTNVTYFNFVPTDELIFREIILNKEEIKKAALSNNPDLKINKYQREKFSNKLSLTRSELLPKFSFKYYTQKIGNDAGFWGVEFGLGVPLWFWWEETGNIKEAGYELDIASNEEINIKRTIENDVNRTFEEFENGLRESLFFHTEAMPETDEILRQAKISYIEGAIDYVEYLQALQIVYETRTQYLRSLFSYYASIYKLEKLIAGEIK